MQHFFKGLKVVELASVLAGPSVGVFFAELGAKVIKIENKKTGGDVTRSWKLPVEDKNEKTSAYFYAVNFLKQHLFLDLEKKHDLERCLNHLKTADILIINYKKGDDKKFGLDYAALKKLNPGLIYAQIHGFSAQDERVAYDLILQAESGFMSMNGTASSQPLKMPVAFIDLFAAHHLKEAILLALIRRNKNGAGAKVTVSLFDAAIASLANQATNWLIAGYLPQPSGSLHPNIAPYGELFQTKDGAWITFAIGSDKQFAALCKLTNLQRLINHHHYCTNQNRVKNRKNLYKLLAKAIRQLNYPFILKYATGNQIPVGKIRNLKEVFELKESQRLIKKIDKRKKINVVSTIPFTLE